MVIFHCYFSSPEGNKKNNGAFQRLRAVRAPTSIPGPARWNALPDRGRKKGCHDAMANSEAIGRPMG